MTEPTAQTSPSIVLPPATTVAAPAPSRRVRDVGILFLLMCVLIGAFIGLAGVLVGYGLSTLLL